MDNCFLPRPAGTWGGRDGAGPLPRPSLATSVRSDPQGLPQGSWVDRSSHLAPTPSARAAIDLGPAGAWSRARSVRRAGPSRHWVGADPEPAGLGTRLLGSSAQNNCVHR